MCVNEINVMTVAILLQLTSTEKLSIHYYVYYDINVILLMKWNDMIQMMAMSVADGSNDIDNSN